ncbi:hypothetical protein SAMN05192535_3833 [Shouchella rhizosphaerae]|nr:hypothetical protein SAMN05192535_3833 [Shouchella rhizosphaerae]
MSALVLGGSVSELCFLASKRSICNSPRFHSESGFYQAHV